MNRICFCVTTMMICMISSIAMGQTTRPSALDAVAPYIGGEWHIKGTWAGGNSLEARDVFEWGLNKKFIVAKTFVKTEDGKEYQRYEAIYADQDGKLVLYNFRFDGEADVRPMEYKGHDISNTWSQTNQDGSTTNFKQSVEMTDDNHFHWHVALQRTKDGPWETIMDGTWERVYKSNSEARR